MGRVRGKRRAGWGPEGTDGVFQNLGGSGNDFEDEGGRRTFKSNLWRRVNGLEDHSGGMWSKVV